MRAELVKGCQSYKEANFVQNNNIKLTRHETAKSPSLEVFGQKPDHHLSHICGLYNFIILQTEIYTHS